MRIAGQLPRFISNSFTPKFTGIYLTNVQATCTNGIVTLTWNEIADPHKDTTRGTIGSTIFSQANRYHLQYFIYSSFTAGTGYSTTFPNADSLNYYWVSTKSIMNRSVSTSSWVTTPTTTNPYEEGTYTPALSSGTPAGCNGYGHPWWGQIELTTDSSYSYASESTPRSVTLNIPNINSTVTNPIRRYISKLTSGNARIFVRPFIYPAGYTFSGDSGYAPYLYVGDWSYVDVNLTGGGLLAPGAPTNVTNFTSSGRTYYWQDTVTDLASYYIYAYKWNGSTWAQLRNGYLADNGGNTGYGNGDQSYTFPAGDGSGYFLITVYTYSPITNTFSSGATPTYITL